MKKINPKNARRELTKQFKTKFIDPSSALLEEGIRHHMFNVLDLSKPFVPVDTGALESSGKAETKRAKNGAEGAVAYGSTSIVTRNAPTGSTSHYAIKVHELHSTKSKYLEKAINMEKTNEQKVIFKPLKDYLN